MERINPKVIAVVLLALGLFLGLVAFLSAYNEGKASAVARTADYEDFEDAASPRS